MSSEVERLQSRVSNSDHKIRQLERQLVFLSATVTDATRRPDTRTLHTQTSTSGVEVHLERPCLRELEYAPDLARMIQQKKSASKRSYANVATTPMYTQDLMDVTETAEEESEGTDRSSTSICLKGRARRCRRRPSVDTAAPRLNKRLQSLLPTDAQERLTPAHRQFLEFLDMFIVETVQTVLTRDEILSEATFFFEGTTTSRLRGQSSALSNDIPGREKSSSTKKKSARRVAL